MVGCAGLVPASVPGMRVSVGLGVSEVSSDPVRDRRPRERVGHGAQSRPGSRVIITRGPGSETCYDGASD